MADLMDQVHPLKIFDLAKDQGRFLYACAPMLAFRQTVHSYGTDLCWTPMILAKEFNRNEFARDSDFTLATTPQPQPPTIVQFGANVPVELARASSLVAPFVAGVDLNCGCPQSWACAETLGAALMERRELVRDMVVETRSRLASDGWAVGLERDKNDPKGRSVSVKIRVHKDLRKTMDFIDTVIGDPNARNIDFLTIHPRTRATPSREPINVESLSILVERYGDVLPILVSGDVFTLDTLAYSSPFSPASAGAAGAPNDTSRPAIPKLRGLMSARGLLANPSLFAGTQRCSWDVVEHFLNRAAQAPLPFKLVTHHLTEMTAPGMGPDKASLLNKRERIEMLEKEDMFELIDWLDVKMAEKRGGQGLRRWNEGEFC
ncbi:tRNA-dihydrouridine synthase 4 [Pyricularia oryzae]|nr:tRNA-dihydrouridine synthase 4 [Pyricularia oryzae]KAI7924823.1 tRNA-dihydrouridine synthase 4 [Pyricularia oryzae]